VNVGLLLLNFYMVSINDKLVNVSLFVEFIAVAALTLLVGLTCQKYYFDSL